MRRTGVGLGRRHGAVVVPPPLLIPDLAAWYRADRGVTLASGVVSAWADQSGSGKTLSQGTAGARPTPVASNAAFNGQPTLSFDGGDSLVAAVASDWNFLHNGLGCTLILVAKGDAANTVYAFCGTQTTVASRGMQLRTTGGGNLVWDVGNGSVDILGLTVLVDLDDALFKTTLRYTEGRAGNEYAYRINGGADTTGISGAAPSASDATGPLTVGARSGAGLTLTGDIAEVIAYSRYITDAEANALDAYLLARYGA